MPPAFWKSSDKHIVARVLRGNRDAFGELVDRYLTRVHAVAYARTGNRADAEEAAQEAFLQAFVSLDHLQYPSRFGPWLFPERLLWCNRLVPRDQIHKTR